MSDFIETKSNTCSEPIVAMIEHQGSVFVAAGNKVWRKWPDRDDLVQMTFINLSEDEK